MNRELNLDNLIAVIRESQCIPESKLISDKTKLEKELGITGDDGCDLLTEIEKQFSLSFVGEDGTLRECFDLEKNQYLFHSEGLNLFAIISSLLGVDTENVKSLTVGDLYEAAVKEKNKSKNG